MRRCSQNIINTPNWPNSYLATRSEPAEFYCDDTSCLHRQNRTVIAKRQLSHNPKVKAFITEASILKSIPPHNIC
jgi:hypothetical protein